MKAHPSLVCLSIVAAVILSAASTASATTYEVASVADLQAAIGVAVAGDTIIVKNGVYTTSAAISVNKVGTAAAPIVIKAETTGGVEFQGTHGISLISPAAYIVIEGFVFSHASGRISMPTGTHHSRYTRNIFQCVGDGAYLSVSGNDHEVDRNEFRNKSTVGNMISVSGSGSQVAQRLWIHHNYFHDFTSAGENGAETIRFGLSGLSLSTGDGLVEHNLFVRCNGENELISNKSSGNVYRYNTFIDSPGAQLTLRHGNECLAYGNYFRNTAGLRVFGDRHQIFSNYFEGNSIGLDMGNGDGEVADGADLTSHDRPDDAVVSFNTFVNNSTHYQMGGRTGGLGATNATVANNIFQGGTQAVRISTTAPYTGTWDGNILWNVPTIGDIPASGYSIENPLLAADASGIFHIQPFSPAIGSAAGSYPAVTVDMDGQPRDAAKDKGADELSAAPVTAKFLTVTDVGPGAGLPPPEPVAPPIDFEAETLAHTEAGGSYSVSFEDTPSGGAFASPHITDPNSPLYPVRHRYVTLGADGVPPPPAGEYIEFTVPNVPRGTYNLVLRYKSHPTNRSVGRLSVDGTTLGSDLNQLSTATFRTKDFGVLRFPDAGNHVVRLAVVGKTNTPTSPWNLTADVITLVPDSKKPVITTPLPDLTLEATRPQGAVATYTGSATDDKDGPVPVVFTPSSGSFFPVGTTLVMATATDFAGNVATASFKVTVVDTTAPVIPGVVASPNVLWPPNHQMVPVTLTADPQDAVGVASTRIVSVSSSDPVNAGGDGNTASDWEVTGDLTVNLRAERAGPGTGRTYTITIESRDAAGNTATATVTVVVPRNPDGH
jgi:Chondroitinase B/HYR domain